MAKAWPFLCLFWFLGFQVISNKSPHELYAYFTLLIRPFLFHDCALTPPALSFFFSFRPQSELLELDSLSNFCSSWSPFLILTRKCPHISPLSSKGNTNQAHFTWVAPNHSIKDGDMRYSRSPDSCRRGDLMRLKIPSRRQLNMSLINKRQLPEDLTKPHDCGCKKASSVKLWMILNERKSRLGDGHIFFCLESCGPQCWNIRSTAMRSKRRQFMPFFPHNLKQSQFKDCDILPSKIKQIKASMSS